MNIYGDNMEKVKSHLGEQMTRFRGDGDDREKEPHIIELNHLADLTDDEYKGMLGY